MNVIDTRNDFEYIYKHNQLSINTDNKYFYDGHEYYLATNEEDDEWVIRTSIVDKWISEEL